MKTKFSIHKKRNGISVPFCFYSLSAFVNAFENWSAQDVFLGPQVLPLRIDAISSAFLPSTSLAIALRLPLHPPIKFTLWMTPFSSSN